MGTPLKKSAEDTSSLQRNRKLEICHRHCDQFNRSVPPLYRCFSLSSSLSFVHVFFFLAVPFFLRISLLFQLLLSCGSFTLFITLFLIHFLPPFTRPPVYISSSWVFYFRFVLLSDLTVLLFISLCSHRIAFLYLLFTS